MSILSFLVALCSLVAMLVYAVRAFPVYRREGKDSPSYKKIARKAGLSFLIAIIALFVMAVTTPSPKENVSEVSQTSAVEVSVKNQQQKQAPVGDQRQNAKPKAQTGLSEQPKEQVKELIIGQEQQKLETTMPKDYSDWLKWVIEKEVGADSNLGIPKIAGIEFEGGNKSKPVIGIVADDNLTRNLVRVGMLNDAMKIFQVVFADKRASTVTVAMFRPITDVYGNSELSTVIAIQMSRKTAERINWENFLLENLPKIADVFYEMPGWN